MICTVKKMDATWGSFLRKARAGQSYSEFAAKVGVSESTLFRYETGEQSVTLRKLEDIMQRLGISLADVFGNEVHLKRTRRN